MDLFQNFIGDRYPLCIDEPDKQYLRKGATYRLIGSHKLTTMVYENPWWRNSENLVRVNLDNSSSALYQVLCNANEITGACEFKGEVVLDSNLACGDVNGVECKVDNVRLVRMQADPEIFYEYLKPPCVELVYSKPSDLTKIVDHQRHAMCLHKNINDAAMASCCPASGSSQSKCEFSMERMSYKKSEDRCAQEGLQMCDFQVRLAEEKTNLMFLQSQRISSTSRISTFLRRSVNFMEEQNKTIGPFTGRRIHAQSRQRSMKMEWLRWFTTLI